MSSFDLGEIFRWSLSERFDLASISPPAGTPCDGEKRGKFTCSSCLKLLRGLLGLGLAGTCPEGYPCAASPS